MKFTKTLVASACATAFLALSIGSASAKITAAEAETLGKTLTPVGGEMAGNKDGTIPTYTGGLTAPPAGWDKSKGYADPFANEKPKFTINAANAEQYKANLPAGALAMMKKYSTFTVPVYPTHRTAAIPKEITDETKKAALVTEVNKGVGVANLGAAYYPFPIPKNGLEAIFNATHRFIGGGLERPAVSFPVRASGDYFKISATERRIYSPNLDVQVPNRRFSFLAWFQGPATLVGTVFLVHEPADQSKEERAAWIYNAGQRRVRRAPDLAYDAVNDGTEGLRFTDQYDGYNGAPDRYDWKLVGKKEMYMPYNAYKIGNKAVKYEQVLTKNHINPDFTRYELHRTWVVEATLKAGQKHSYGKRTFYLDEDSWMVLWEDAYDTRGDLWRVGVHGFMQYYDAGVPWTRYTTFHDLTNGAYLFAGLDNDIKGLPQFNLKGKSADFTPDALRRAGTK
jgi:Protein of unknown function (DUF1329)